MSVNKRTIIVAGVFQVFTGFFQVFSQYTMNSPYSRFGIGDLEAPGFVLNQSMGGLGISLRVPNQINILNPASYTAQDTLSSVWDIGLKGAMTKYSTSSRSLKQNNFNFDHLALSATISKHVAISTGLLPFSKTGYDYQETFMFPDSEYMKEEYSGSGNINKFYVGAGFAFLNKKLNIGYNLSYLFGSIANTTYWNMLNTAKEDYGYYAFNHYDLSLSGAVHTFGMQGVIPLSHTSDLTIGLVYEPKSRLSADYVKYLQRGSDTITIAYDTGYYKIPSRFGAGICYSYKDKLTLGIDYVTQDWSKATFIGKKDSLQRYNRLSIGAEYVYDRASYLSYWAKVRFRMGFYYENSYLRMYQKGIDDYGFSLGLAFPLRRTNTFFNVGFEMGKRGTTQNNLIEDNYKRIFVSISLYDFWFFKRKYD
jgi:hypothetical protein